MCQLPLYGTGRDWVVCGWGALQRRSAGRGRQVRGRGGRAERCPGDTFDFIEALGTAHAACRTHTCRSGCLAARLLVGPRATSPQSRPRTPESAAQSMTSDVEFLAPFQA